MPRWEPNARQRLVEAALELFAEQGYERTTVAGIAERAGLTKSTFFRHFPDKREVLFGADALAAELAAGVEAAPEDADPMEAVAHALRRAGGEAFPADRRAWVARRAEVVAANPELQEREALKSLRMTAAMVEALRSRGVADLPAQVAAQLGTLALARAYEGWIAGAGGPEFGELATRALTEVRAATAA